MKPIIQNDPWGSFDTFINAPETKQFVGKNFDKYQQKWTKLNEKSLKIREKKNLPWFQAFVGMTFNPGALILWPAWFGYRKMHKMFFVITGLLAILTLVEEIMKFSLPSGGYIGFFVVLSTMANTLYLQHTIKLLADSAGNPDERMDVIKRHGGTSPMFAIGYTLLLVIVLLAVIFGVELVTG